MKLIVIFSENSSNCRYPECETSVATGYGMMDVNMAGDNDDLRTVNKNPDRTFHG
jgi:hypothetical protein